MGRRSLLYVETSVFGFYYDEEPRNVLRREAVRMLFQQIAIGLLDAVTSPATSGELAEAAEPVKGRLLGLLEGIPAIRAEEAEVRRMAELYLRERVVPPGEDLDARHAAYATVGRADVIVSLNLRHLANEWAERRLNSVNLREGYPLVSIRTPEQVVLYED